MASKFIQSVVGDSIARVKSDVKSIPKQIKSGIKGAIQNAKNNVTAAARGAVNNAINTGLNVATQSAIQLIKGNGTEALNVLTAGPANIYDNAVAGLLGKGKNSLSLSAPLQVTGVSSQASSNGGVAEGDALRGAMARSDPLLTYCWYCELPVVNAFGPADSNSGAMQSTFDAKTNILTGGLNPTSYTAAKAAWEAVENSSLLGNSAGQGGGQGAVELPWYFIEEANLPFRTFGTRSIFREGRDRHYPDKYSIDNLTVSIYADTSNRALDYLQAWNSAILRPFSGKNSITQGGHFGRPSEYKQVIRFYLMSVARQQVAMLEYTECWPVSMDTVSLGSDSSDRVIYNVNFSVGDVFLTTFAVDTALIAQAAENPLMFPTTIGGAINSVFNAGMERATQYAADQFTTQF